MPKTFISFKEFIKRRYICWRINAEIFYISFGTNMIALILWSQTLFPFVRSFVCFYPIPDLNLACFSSYQQLSKQFPVYDVKNPYINLHNTCGFSLLTTSLVIAFSLAKGYDSIPSSPPFVDKANICDLYIASSNCESKSRPFQLYQFRPMTALKLFLVWSNKNNCV